MNTSRNWLDQREQRDWRGQKNINTERTDDTHINLRRFERENQVGPRNWKGQKLQWKRKDWNSSRDKKEVKERTLAEKNSKETQRLRHSED